MRGLTRPAVVRGWHRSRWRPELACAEHAPGLARALPLGQRPTPPPPPPWAAAVHPASRGLIAGFILPSPLPVAATPAGPPLCRTCLLRGLSAPAVVRGWHRSRWRIEGACSEHAPGLARVVPLVGPLASAAPASTVPTSPPPAASLPPRPHRRRRLGAAGGALALAGAGALVWALADRGAPGPSAPTVSAAALAPSAAAGAPRAPQLIGWRLARARGALQGIRLVVGGRRTATAPAGVVLAQRPSPGTPIAPGGALVVAIALAPPTPPAPAPPPAVAAAAAAAPTAPGLPTVRAASLRPAASRSDACARGWGDGWGAYRC
jgi:hypothetical protein